MVECNLEECLDKLREIFIKYSPSHTVVLGGDFHASLHCGEDKRRDVLFLNLCVKPSSSGLLPVTPLKVDKQT